MHQLWDKLFKIVGDCFPQEIVDFIFPGQQVKLCEKYEQERIVIEYQIADINFWIEDNGERKLLNIEPYSHWSKSIPLKVFTRNAILTKSLKYKHEVISVVVLLKKKARYGRHRTFLQNQAINSFYFPVISLGDVQEILKNHLPLAPFILKVEPSYTNKVIKAVQGSKILTYVTVLILNRLGMSQEEALTMTGLKLKDFGQALMEVPIMKTVAKEWRDDEKKKLAQKMLAKQMTVELIAELTGLGLDEIIKLKNS